MTVTVKDKSQLMVPPSVQRQAGFKMGDRLEFTVTRGVITIAAKSDDDHHNTEQRRAVDQQLAASDRDASAGRIYGPFAAGDAEKFLRKELKVRANKSRTK